MVGYFLAKNRFAISTFVEILIHDTNLYIFGIITKKKWRNYCPMRGR